MLMFVLTFSCIDIPFLLLHSQTNGWNPSTFSVLHPLRSWWTYIFLFDYFKLSLFSPVLIVDDGGITFSYEQLELADPDFYKIGYVRSFRAYGIEFREGPDGYGVFASKDVEPLRRARVSTTLQHVCMYNVFLLLMKCLTISITIGSSVKFTAPSMFYYTKSWTSSHQFHHEIGGGRKKGHGRIVIPLNYLPSLWDKYL